MKKETLPTFNKLVIVSYRLPFRFVKTHDHTVVIPNSGGLVSAILSLSERMQLPGLSEGKIPIHWIGRGDEIPPGKMTGPLGESPFTLHPVSIPANLNEKYYSGFCNNTLWPLFHYFPWLTNFREDQWEAYVQANKRFADVLDHIIQPGDFIWIHDYQLFLLPEMVRKRFPKAMISFFLHIPFPSFEIFRLMPRKWRTSIINGVLGADTVGFHTHAYARYFLLSVRNTLKLPYAGKSNIIIDGRQVSFNAFPIGIDYEKFHGDCTSGHVLKEKQKIQKFIGKKKLIFSIDRLDYTKGLIHRLHGYETFLDNNRDWHEKVVFNMILIPSRDSIAQYQSMKKEIEAIVGRINGKFSNLGWRPVIYQYRSLQHAELVARYDMSDVGLITPLRDGMNLVAKEYIACQVQNQGVLILSEMAGAADELSEAIIINPYDQHEIAQAIQDTLEMPAGIKQERNSLMQKKVRKNDVIQWAMSIFNHTLKTNLNYENIGSGNLTKN